MVDPQGHSVSHGQHAFARLMAQDRPPTAVLAANDRLSLGGLRWCQERGLDVPGDLAIMGYDNVEYGAYASTPLSSVDYPSADLVRRALARLMALIANGDRLPLAEVVRIRPALVLRQSTGAVP